MASLIKEFGFKVPVVARSDGSVIDGHLRLKAARYLGMETVPVVLADEWTEAQVKAFRIAVNKSAELAEWDTDLLALEIEDLKELDFDLELTGFELPELDEILSAGEQAGTEGQTVLDLFGGSGSTLIACEKTGRVCRMMELSPRYCDVIVNRWQDFTGQEATLDDGGKTFAQVKEERGG